MPRSSPGRTTTRRRKGSRACGAMRRAATSGPEPGFAAPTVERVRRGDRPSPDLYESAYRAPAEFQDLVTDPGSTARAQFARLSSTIKRQVNVGDRYPDADDAPAPDHWHTVPGLLVPRLGTEAAEDPTPLMVSSESMGRTLLFDSGDGWRLHWPFSHRIASWSDGPSLTPGRVYEIAHIPSNGERCGVGVFGDAVGDLSEAEHPEPALAE